MSASGPDFTTQGRIIRRLGRLFRIERTGGFARRPPALVWRLIARRSALLAQLAGLERRRREAEAAPSPELRAAVRELAGEVDRSRTFGETLAAGLGAELRARRGESRSSGLRDTGTGRLLGSG